MLRLVKIPAFGEDCVYTEIEEKDDEYVPSSGSLVDSSFYVPNSEIVKTAGSCTGVYDGNDERNVNWDMVKLRAKGKDITEVSEIVKDIEGTFRDVYSAEEERYRTMMAQKMKEQQKNIARNQSIDDFINRNTSSNNTIQNQ